MIQLKDQFAGGECDQVKIMTTQADTSTSYCVIIFHVLAFLALRLAFRVYCQSVVEIQHRLREKFIRKKFCFCVCRRRNFFFSESRSWMLKSRAMKRRKLVERRTENKKHLKMVLASFHHQSIISCNGSLILLQFRLALIFMMRRQMSAERWKILSWSSALVLAQYLFVRREKPATAPLSRRTVSFHCAVRSRRTGNVCRRQLKLSLDLRARRPTVRTEGYCTLLPACMHFYGFWFLSRTCFMSTRLVVVHVTTSTYAAPIRHHARMSIIDYSSRWLPFTCYS